MFLPDYSWLMFIFNREYKNKWNKEIKGQWFKNYMQEADQTF